MIKHLTPKSRKELEESLINLPNSITKIKLLNENFIEVTKKEANKIFNELPPHEKIKIAQKKDSYKIVKKIIKNTSEFQFSDIYDIIMWAHRKKYKDIYNSLIKNISSREKISVGIKTNDDKLIKKTVKDPNLDLYAYEFQQLIKWAINHDHRNIVKTVFLNDIKKKSNIGNIESEYLKLVLAYGEVKLIKLLLDAGVNIHVDMETPFIQACYAQQKEIIVLLLDAGADIHAQNDMPLRSVCMGGNIEIAEILIKSGADVHVENDEPLRLAAANGHVEILKLLIKNGADTSAHNYLALYWASLDENKSEIIQILENEKAKHEEERSNKT